MQLGSNFGRQPDALSLSLYLVSCRVVSRYRLSCRSFWHDEALLFAPLPRDKQNGANIVCLRRFCLCLCVCVTLARLKTLNRAC